jgi:hypothetical protein
MGFNNIQKLGFTGCLAVCLLIPLSIYPCWGSRPLSMGGAFTGVADDVNAVYWNPAGLAQLDHPGFTSMFATNPDKINYDQYIGYSMPLHLELTPGGLTATVGFAYTYNKDPDYIGYVGDLGGGKYDVWNITNANNDFLHLCGGMFIYEDKVAVGVNLKMMTRSLTLEEWNYDNNTDDWTFIGKADFNDQAYDMDLGILCRFGPKINGVEGSVTMFSVGCLVQNFLRSEFKDFGTRNARNYRPGFAYRPNDDVLLSAEIYDATTEVFDKPQLRFGGEFWIAHHPTTQEKFIALRAGAYHANQQDMKANTYGLGIRVPLTIKDNKKSESVIELDYAVMQWVDAGESTHLISVGVQF